MADCAVLVMIIALILWQHVVTTLGWHILIVVGHRFYGNSCAFLLQIMLYIITPKIIKNRSRLAMLLQRWKGKLRQSCHAPSGHCPSRDDTSGDIIGRSPTSQSLVSTKPGCVLPFTDAVILRRVRARRTAMIDHWSFKLHRTTTTTTQ